jgi:hypothetical protein
MGKTIGAAFNCGGLHLLYWLLLVVLAAVELHLAGQTAAAVVVGDGVEGHACAIATQSNTPVGYLLTHQMTYAPNMCSGAMQLLNAFKDVQEGAGSARDRYTCWHAAGDTPLFTN